MLLAQVRVGGYFGGLLAKARHCGFNLIIIQLLK